MLISEEQNRAAAGQPCSTWFVRSLDEVLGSEGFAIGVFGVRREPGVQVGAEHVHQDLGKQKPNQTHCNSPRTPQILLPIIPAVNPRIDNLCLQCCLNPRFRSSFSA